MSSDVLGEAGGNEVKARIAVTRNDEAGFEINTDAALIDPDWDDHAQSHNHRFGLAIAHLKASVKGRSFDNDVMSLRVSKNGYFTQSKRFPGAFFGDSGVATWSYVDESEARAAIWEAVAHYRADEARSLVSIYSSDDPPDFFFGYRPTEDRRYEIGNLLTELPLHLRVLFDAEQEVPVIGARSGILIYQRTDNGRHVLVRAKGRRRPMMVAGKLEL